jgi:hypothetical protein
MEVITRGAVIRALEKMRKDGVKVNAICLAVDRATDKQSGYWYGFLYQNTLRKKDPLEQFNNTEKRHTFLRVASKSYPKFKEYLLEPNKTDSKTVEAYKTAQQGLKMLQSALEQISKEIVV